MTTNFNFSTIPTTVINSRIGQEENLHNYYPYPPYELPSQKNERINQINQKLKSYPNQLGLSNELE